MMKLFIVGLIVAAFSYSSILHAQTCPVEINVSEKLNDVPVGWTASSTGDKYRLQGMSIYEGHPDNLGIIKPDDSKLGPIRMAVWKFTRPFGTDEAWMRCHYAGTNIILQIRISSDVSECSYKSGKSSPMLASCVVAD